MQNKIRSHRIRLDETSTNYCWEFAGQFASCQNVISHGSHDLLPGGADRQVKRSLSGSRELMI
jgi:hypothetical protein